jgi:hypothetical protein
MFAVLEVSAIPLDQLFQVFSIQCPLWWPMNRSSLIRLQVQFLRCFYSVTACQDCTPPARQGRHERVELDVQLFRSWAAVGSIFTAQDTSYELQRKSSTPTKNHSKAKNHLKMRLHVYCTCSSVPGKAPVSFFFRELGSYHPQERERTVVPRRCASWRNCMATLCVNNNEKTELMYILRWAFSISCTLLCLR